MQQKLVLDSFFIMVNNAKKQPLQAINSFNNKIF